MVRFETVYKLSSFQDSRKLEMWRIAQQNPFMEDGEVLEVELILRREMGLEGGWHLGKWAGASGWNDSGKNVLAMQVIGFSASIDSFPENSLQSLQDELCSLYYFPAEHP